MPFHVECESCQICGVEFYRERGLWRRGGVWRDRVVLQVEGVLGSLSFSPICYKRLCARLQAPQTWLILPAVICLSQRLSHACLSVSFYMAGL